MNRRNSFLRIIALFANHCQITIGILAFCLFFPFYSQAQPKLEYQSFTHQEGLESESVFSILEDHLGFIWIGNLNGLSRFDGQNFLNYRNEAENLESINHNWVLALHEDKEYNLWVGTEIGLNKLDRKTGKFLRIPIDEENKEVEFQIEEIFEDETGNIWINNRERKSFYKLIQNSDEKNKWKLISFDLGAKLGTEYGNLVQYSLMHIHASVLWIYTNLGIVQYDYLTDRIIELIPHPKPHFQAILRFPKATCTPDGILYYFIPNNFFSIDTQKNNPKIVALDLPKDNGFKKEDWEGGFVKLSHDRSGVLLFSVKTELYSWDIAANEIGTFEYIPKGAKVESDAHVMAFLKDTKENYWMGTYLKGLHLGTPINDAFTLYKNIPNDSLFMPKGRFFSLLEDPKGDFWMSYLDNWLYKVHLNKDGRIEKKASINLQAPPFQKLAINQVGKIVQTADKHLVLSLVNDGIIELDSTGSLLMTEAYYSMEALSFVEDRVSDLAIDGNNNIWAASLKNGLRLIERKTGKVTQFIHDPQDTTSIINGKIYRLNFDRQGRLWIGTNVGLDCYDPKTGVFQHYISDSFDPTSLSYGEVTSIYEDSKGNIWIGTKRGLNLLKEDRKTFERYYHSGGISYSFICNIMEDDEGTLWVVTIDGLMKKLPEDSDKEFLSFGIESGLPKSTIRYRTYINSPFSELIYFGTYDGLTALNPSLFGKEKSKPKMVIHSIQRFKRETGFSESTTDYWLDPEKNSINIDYSDQAITLTLGDLNRFNHLYKRYEYQLKGFSNQWWPLAENLQITLNSLPRGNYQLLARARNLENRPLESTKLLDIKVYPPWWKSNWAYFAYVFILSSILLLAYNFQIRRKLEKQEAENLRSIDAFKNNLFTNITHEFRTPLMIILGMMDQIEKKPEQLLKKGSQLIKKNGKILLNLINQILELHRLEAGIQELDMQQGDILPLLRNIFDQFQTYAQNKEQELRFISMVYSLKMDYDQEKIWRIVSNLLSNAIKYTPEGGEISFMVSKGESPSLMSRENLIISVQDTGAGIPKDQLPYIFDRYYQASKDETLKKENPGTGIGLSLIKELVNLLEGKIEVDSKLGLGTTFYVYLPITHEAAIKQNTDFDKIQSIGVDNALLMDNGIPKEDDLQVALIVEDNPDVMLYLQASLEGKYKLEVAPNGKIGIEKALELIPDIIISDVMMPEVDGFELCEDLKKDIKTSHIPIILLTAKSDFASKIKGLKNGADAYLAKPFSQEELEIRMQNLLSTRQKLHQRYKDLYHQVPLFDSNNAFISKEDFFIEDLKNAFEKYMLDPDFDVTILCKDLQLSRSTLSRKVKALTGRSLSIYLRSLRLQKAKHLLLSSDLPVKSIAYEVGFINPSYFTATYTQEFGESPSQTRENRPLTK
ncbi:MAG: two-component regulator propeller domain-containing protein [Bacteroidota bacterium]